MPQRILTTIVSIMTEAWDFVCYTSIALMAFIAPVTDLLWFAGFVIFIDLVTGSWASIKRGEKFDSKKLQRSWAKIVLYPLGIIFSFCAEAFAPEVPFVKGATYLLIVIEGKSMEENFSSILGFSMMNYIKTFILKGRKGLIEEIRQNE